MSFTNMSFKKDLKYEDPIPSYLSKSKIHEFVSLILDKFRNELNAGLDCFINLFGGRVSLFGY